MLLKSHQLSVGAGCMMLGVGAFRAARVPVLHLVGNSSNPQRAALKAPTQLNTSPAPTDNPNIAC